MKNPEKMDAIMFSGNEYQNLTDIKSKSHYSIYKTS